MPASPTTSAPGDLTPLFQTIVDHVPPPRLDTDGPFKMLVTLLDRDPFLGRILTGRIESGTLDVNMPIKAIDIDGTAVEEGRATKVFAFRGLERVPGRAGQGGRHRRHRRPDQGDRLQHHRRSRLRPAARAPARSIRRLWR